MGRIELDHWFVKGNKLMISLMRFYAEIKTLKDDEILYYQLFVKDSFNDELIFVFYTLEDAISFTECVINKCNDTTEILQKYVEMFDNKEFSKPYLKKKTKKL